VFAVYIRSKLHYDRQSVGRHPSGTRDQFLFLLEIFFRKLRICYFEAPSLTRGRGCNLLLLLVLASPVPLWSESRGTQDHILLSQFLRLPEPGEPSPRIYIPQELGEPDIPPPPGHWVPFPSPLTTRRATVEVFSPASTREAMYILSTLRICSAHVRSNWYT
jgi:hypothetical protein